MKKFVAIFSDGESHSSVSIRSEREFLDAMEREQVVTVPGRVRWGALFDFETGNLELQVFNPPKSL